MSGRHFVAALFAVGAIGLAAMDKEGWGWCIFAAILFL